MSADISSVENADDLTIEPSPEELDYSGDELLPAIVPDVNGLSLDYAGRILRHCGLEASTTAPERLDEFGFQLPHPEKKPPLPPLKAGLEHLFVVQKQTPEAGAEVLQGTLVHLEYETTIIRVKPNKILLGLAIAALAIIAFIGAVFVVNAWTNRAIVMPNYVGLTQEVAINSASQQGFVVNPLVKTVLSSAKIGTVVEQTPVYRAKVPSGTSVQFTVSGGNAPATVPTLKGLSESAATLAIAKAGLKIESVREISSRKPERTVVQQSLDAGTTTFRGNGITIFVSAGEAKIPQVGGLSVKKATKRLSTAGFDPQVFYVTGAPGIVAAQFPAGKTSYPVGSQVAIMVGADEPKPTKSPKPTVSPKPKPTPTVTITVTPSPTGKPTP